MLKTKRSIVRVVPELEASSFKILNLILVFVTFDPISISLNDIPRAFYWFAPLMEPKNNSQEKEAIERLLSWCTTIGFSNFS